MVFAFVYLIAMFGDFLLMRTINAQIDAVGGEGRRIMNERYQTQDRALIAEAEREGYKYRILFHYWQRRSGACLIWAGNLDLRRLIWKQTQSSLFAMKVTHR